jgi:hypothetical protein
MQVKSEGQFDNNAYEAFNYSATEYRILKSAQDLESILDDPRYWRIVESDMTAVNMLRVPLQIKNNVLFSLEQKFGIRLANRNELASAFQSGPTHQYRYPWGDQVSAERAPFLLRSNPNGMGMNIAGLYFNGPDNKEDSRKNGLWMVTAERDAKNNYISGDRSGTAGNVGVFDQASAMPGNRAALSENRGVLPENRGALAGHRGALPENRGVLPENRGTLAAQSEDSDNFLTPAGVGEGLELYPNEGYLMVKELADSERQIYATVKEVLANKVSADHGITGVSIGDAAKALNKEHSATAPVIVFGVFGHCLNCPNPRTLTMPINGPEIAVRTGIPVIEYPEFENHKVLGRRAIMPETYGSKGVDTQKRIYLPAI